MAKERKSAVSLFADMGKNRDTTTETVSAESGEMASQPTGQYDKNVENAENMGIVLENEEDMREEKPTILTNEDNNTKVKKNESEIITDDIQSEESYDGSDKTESHTTDYLPEEAPRKRGRKPSKDTQEFQHIHIALPLDVYEKLEIGKKAYYNNKTIYIRNLIINDYEKNKEIYENLPTIR